MLQWHCGCNYRNHVEQYNWVPCCFMKNWAPFCQSTHVTVPIVYVGWQSCNRSTETIWNRWAVCMWQSISWQPCCCTDLFHFGAVGDISEKTCWVWVQHWCHSWQAASAVHSPLFHFLFHLLFEDSLCLSSLSWCLNAGWTCTQL